MATFRAIPQLPLKFDGDPASLLDAAAVRAKRALEAVDEVISKVSVPDASFANTVLPLIEAENERIHNDPPISFYSHVSPLEEVRNASRQAEKILSSAMVDIYSRQKLYDLVVAVSNNSTEVENLDDESKEYLSRLQYSLEEAGFSIPDGPKRHRYLSLRKQIEHLKIDINKNYNQGQEGLWLSLDDLDGVSEDIIRTLRKKGQDEFWLELGTAVTQSVLSEATRSATRKSVFVKDAYRQTENASLLRELFLLRDEAARLLGYSSHAAFRVKPNLVSTPEKVLHFLKSVHCDIAPLLESSMQELITVKKEYLSFNEQEPWDDTEKIFLWDTLFYRKLSQAQKFQYDEGKLKEYFPLEKVVSEMLRMVELLFQIHFEKVEVDDSKSLIWHENVLMYRVWDAKDSNGAFMGYFYYDLYTRPAKTRQCIAFSLQKGFHRLDGGRRYPTSVVLLSVNKSTNSQPCLLTHFQVLALLHETGHAIHNLVSTTTYGLLHGTGVSRDFVEVHATVLEKLMTVPIFLKRISCHYAHISPEYAQMWRDGAADSFPLPEREIPDQLVSASLMKSSDFSLFRTYSNLALSFFDMAVHNASSHEALKKMDLAETFNRIHADIRRVHGMEALGEGWSWGHAFVNFRQLSGSYDAQYYTYISSRVYALAIFDTFGQHETTIREGYMRFRDTIMKPGGSKPASALLADFFGKDLELWEIVQKFGVEKV